jgi:hypothetical protein
MRRQRSGGADDPQKFGRAIISQKIASTAAKAGKPNASHQR